MRFCSKQLMFYSIIKGEYKNTAYAHAMVFYSLNKIAVRIVSLLHFVLFFLHEEFLYRK